MKVLIPMAGLINKEEEITRLQKEIDKKENELQRGEGKLSNSNFVDKAPPEVVEKERAKLEEIRSVLQNLKDQLQRISSI